jgi:hypothetical protein
LFGRQGVGDGNHITISRVSTNFVGHIGRFGGARLIFETFEVGSNIIAVDFDLDLAWERDINGRRVWCEIRVDTTVKQ